MEPGNLPSSARSTPPGQVRAAPSSNGSSLADVLERVLDKGVVIVGDVGVSIVDVELLTLKIRLLVASADTARRMGIDWWSSDPFLSSDARKQADELEQLRHRVAELEAEVGGAGDDGSRAVADRQEGARRER
jgi:hypothetical protein